MKTEAMKSKDMTSTGTGPLQIHTYTILMTTESLHNKLQFTPVFSNGVPRSS